MFKLLMAHLERLSIREQTQSSANRRVAEGIMSSPNAQYGFRYQYFLVQDPTILVTSHKLLAPTERVDGEYTCMRHERETRQMESLIDMVTTEIAYDLVVKLRELGLAKNERSGDEWEGGSLRRAVQSYIEKKNRA